MLKTIIESFEGIVRSVEVVPGWARAERFLDQVADGVAFALALLWALRWYYLLIGVALVATGVVNSP